jgi:N-acetylglutamate synthase-like GNAT family acetyltransferase
MMTIKKAIEKNSQILAQIFSVLYSKEIKSEGKIKQNIIGGKKEYYIGFLDNQPIGALSLKFGDKQCELEAIVVKDKGRGHGSQLLKFAEDLAKKRKCNKIWCLSLVQHGVKDFYKKHGWVEEDFIRDLHPGEDCFKFSKHLD